MRSRDVARAQAKRRKQAIGSQVVAASAHVLAGEQRLADQCDLATSAALRAHPGADMQIVLKAAKAALRD